jgi:hypothetical protein
LRLPFPVPLLLAAAFAARALAGDGDEAPSCTTHCHGKEATEFARSVHAPTLTCVLCHGGNPAAHRDKEKSHDAAMGYVGKPDRRKAVDQCGECHGDTAKMLPFGIATDQLARYRTSNHGRALFEKGDLAAAICTDCHGAHGILRARDAAAPTSKRNQPATCGRCHSDPSIMEPRGLSADSVRRYSASVHGRALLVLDSRGAPSCADCHSSHGAYPPGASNVVAVCAQCHEDTAEHYRRGPHHPAEKVACRGCHDGPEAAGHAYAGAGCTACHSPHETALPSDAMYEGAAVGTCGHCHRKADGWEAAKEAILGGRNRLREATEETLRELQEAKSHGVFLDSEQAYLLESRRALVAVRPLVHAMDANRIAAHLDEGLRRHERTREIIRKRTTALRDRRIFMAGLSAVLLLVAGLLWMKLGEVRRLS